MQGVSTTDEDDLTGIPLKHSGYIRLVLPIFFSYINVGLSVLLHLKKNSIQGL